MPHNLLVKALGSKHMKVLRATWSDRRSLTPATRTRDELSFLPAHLELIETPVSSSARYLIRIIALFFVLVFLWAWFGRLDIVTVAQGKLITVGRAKIIQPIETAVVRSIYVRDGQRVNSGDLLVELDATGVSTEAEKTRKALATARLSYAKSGALIEALTQGRVPKILPSGEASSKDVAQAQQQVIEEFNAYRSHQNSLQADVDEKAAELDTTAAMIGPLREYAKISYERVSDYKKLLSKNYVSRQEYLAREQERIVAVRELESQIHHKREIVASLASARESLSANRSDYLQRSLEERRQAEQRIVELESEAGRADQRLNFMQLRSPVSGTVQQLNVHTVGGVVTPAQAIMTVVPVDDPLEVEVNVLDRDIGFVRTGLDAAVKLEAFPYTRYGYIEGKVISVSREAIKDDKAGLVFPIRIKLERQSLVIGPRTVNLISGMGVVAELKTGKRRVVDYFLDPLRVAREDSLHER